MQMNNHSSSATDFLVWKVLFARLVQSIWIELLRLTSSVGLNVSRVIVLLLRLLLFSISFDLVKINSFSGQKIQNRKTSPWSVAMATRQSLSIYRSPRSPTKCQHVHAKTRHFIKKARETDRASWIFITLFQRAKTVFLFIKILWNKFRSIATELICISSFESITIGWSVWP